MRATFQQLPQRKAETVHQAEKQSPSFEIRILSMQASVMWSGSRFAGCRLRTQHEIAHSKRGRDECETEWRRPGCR